MKSKTIFKMAAMSAILNFSARYWLCLIYKFPRYFLLRFESIRLLVQETKRKIYFQDGGHGGLVGFSIETILTILVENHLGNISVKFS